MITFFLGVALGCLITALYATVRMRKKLVPITAGKLFLIMPKIQELLDLEETTDNSIKTKQKKLETLTEPAFYVMFSDSMKSIWWEK